MNFLFALPNGAEPDQLSAKFINNYYKFSGEEHVVKESYSKLTDALARGCKIELNQVVDEINYADPYKKVQVTTKEGRVYKVD